MVPEPADRIDTLAKRVRWLDRYRRAVSVALAMVIWFALMWQFHGLTGDSPLALIPTIAATMFAVPGWWLVETAFAYLTAIWEVQHDRLAREGGLPRAELVRRR